MIAEGYNHHDVFVGGEGESLCIRVSIDSTEARFRLQNGRTVCELDLDKGEVRKLGEMLMRMSTRMGEDVTDETI